jgi:putative heme degradation protein
MCLTRNGHAVHERYGEFRHIDFFNGMGQVVGPDID